MASNSHGSASVGQQFTAQREPSFPADIEERMAQRRHESLLDRPALGVAGSPNGREIGTLIGLSAGQNRSR